MSAGAPPLENHNLWRPAVNPWIIAITVTLATFMEVLDTSIANVALPHIAGGLSAGQDESTWVLTSYLVSNAIVLPLSGWLSSIMGRKNFYMSCVALFTVSSFLCGLAPNLTVLIICRVLQGVGGGGLQPSEQAILADTFEPAKRGMAFAIYGVAVVTAPAIGPTLGGWITDNFTWRWIFFINIPVGIISILLTSRLIQDPPYLKRRKLSETHIDYIGLGFVALGLGTLQVVLDKGQRDDWFDSHFILIMTLVSAVSLIFVVVWEWKQKDPIIDLHLFRDRTFGISNLLMFMLGFALLGSTLLLPLMMQTLLGYTAETAGLALMPGGLTIMLLLPLVGFLLSRYSPRWLLVFGLVMLSGSLFNMTRFNLQIPFSTTVTARIFQAIGMAFLFVPINTAAYAYLPRDKNNAASGLMNLARNIGGSVGISLVTTLLDRRTQTHLNDFAARLSPANPAFQSMLQGATAAMKAHGSNAALATGIRSHPEYASTPGHDARLYRRFLAPRNFDYGDDPDSFPYEKGKAGEHGGALVGVIIRIGIAHVPHCHDRARVWLWRWRYCCTTRSEPRMESLGQASHRRNRSACACGSLRRDALRRAPRQPPIPAGQDFLARQLRKQYAA
jgi:DHA2 family multidrug resistance protein